MKPLHVWTSDHFSVCLPQSHALPAAKYPQLREQLRAARVIPSEHLHRSTPAPLAWLERVHAKDYVARVVAGALESSELRRLGMPWSIALVQRARAALFGAVMAARAALGHGVAANLAGGSHHAFRDRGEGYCLFNDIAVAIALMLEANTIDRPFVLDLDVHQGNGTAAIFRDEPRVFTFSMHGARNYIRCARSRARSTWSSTMAAMISATWRRWPRTCQRRSTATGPIACSIKRGWTRCAKIASAGSR